MSYIPFPQVDHITKSQNTTIVHWQDGTSTPVTLSQDEPQSEYTAFCAALAKRVYGTTSFVHRLVDRKSDEYIKAKKDAAKLAAKTLQIEREARNHERKVRKVAKEMRLHNEAKLLAAKESKNDLLEALKTLVMNAEEEHG